MAGQLKNDNPGHDLTTEELRQGGINSGIARAKKKSLREKAQLLMSLSVKDEKDIKKLEELGIDKEHQDIEMMNLIHMLNIIKKENFNSVGAFNSLKELTEKESSNNGTPQVQINIVNNEELEKYMYESDE